MTAAVFALLIIVGGFVYTADRPVDDHSKIHICVGNCVTHPKEPCKEEEEDE